MHIRQLLRMYKVPASFLSIRMAIWLLVGEIILGTIFYSSVEGYNIGDAFYMVVITVSTVGFSEVEPLSHMGRMFTAVLIVANIGVIAYLLAVFSYYIIEGEIFKRMHLNQNTQRIKDLHSHVIICGYGRYGREIATNFASYKIDYVVIENSAEKVEEIQQADEDILYINGDATQDEVLQEAGIENARGLISALGDDSDNLFIVLSARQLNPRLKIISRAVKPRSQSKLMKAGASHVVMPENIGGFYMATLISKPGAVEFFSFMTDESHSDMGFEELTYKDMPEEYRGRPIVEMKLRSLTGANIIGHRNENGNYIVNPGPGIVLNPGCSFIVLGSQEQLRKLRELCGMVE